MSPRSTRARGSGRRVEGDRPNLLFELDALTKPEDDIRQSVSQACSVLGRGRERCERDHRIPRSTSVDGDRDSGSRKAFNFAKLTKNEVGDRHSGQSRSFSIGAAGGQGCDRFCRRRCRGHGLLFERWRHLRRRRRGGGRRGRSKNAADQRHKARIFRVIAHRSLAVERSLATFGKDAHHAWASGRGSCVSDRTFRRAKFR
ncbi:hypothetical protein ACVWWO_002019 [Bradyrhizobium sp. F1.13.1]